MAAIGILLGAASDFPIVWDCNITAAGTGSIAIQVDTGLSGNILFNKLSGTVYDIKNSGTAANVCGNQYTHSKVNGTLTYLAGDRAAYSVEDWHGSDIEAAAPTRHTPLPGGDGGSILSSGGIWTRVTTWALAMLADWVRGKIIRGGAAAWEAYDAKGAGFIVQGDGTDVKSAAFDWDTIGAGSGADMVHTHGSAGEGGKLEQANTHESADTDVATTSLHHTIGATATTAAAGNHTHVLTDANAIHVNVSGEINGLTEKLSPVDNDLLVIEDSEDTNAKKKVKKSNLGAGGIGGSTGGVDNAVLRADGIGEATVQNSLATVDDSGGINIPTGQTYNINGSPHTHAGGSAHVIQDEGSPLTDRANLNFVGAGVTATDDAGNNATVVTIPGGAGGGDFLVVQVFS